MHDARASPMLCRTVPPSTGALVALLWVSSLALGCGGGASSGAPSGTGGGTSMEQVVDLTTCDAPTLCPVVESGYGEGVIRKTDESLRCAIQVLHDRTPGLLFEKTTVFGLGSTNTATIVYLVKPDGMMQREALMEHGPSAPQLCPLLPPADYEPCLASTSTDGYATPACDTQSWTSGCEDSPVSCE
jgi:hypothetical protein